MFHPKEIELMKRLGLTINFSSPSDNELVRIEEVVGDFYTQEAQETNAATETILLCESILDKM